MSPRPRSRRPGADVEYQLIARSRQPDLVARGERQLELEHVRAVVVEHLVWTATVQDRRRIVVAEQGLTHLAEPVDADHLAIEEGNGSDGDGAELLLDERQVFLLDLPESGEVATRARRQDAVGDDQVARIAEQVEVRERALGFGD